MAGRSASAAAVIHHGYSLNGRGDAYSNSTMPRPASRATPSLAEEPHVVETLTEDERDLIADVLNRDSRIKELEEKRVRFLRSEFQRLKDKSAQSLMTALDSGRGVCGVCGANFSLFLNRGTACQRCKIRVCKNCQVPSSPPKLRRSASVAAFGPSAITQNNWHCTLCDKRISIQKQTGEWIYLQSKNRAVRDSWRSKGPELVRALLVNSPGSAARFHGASTPAFDDGDGRWDSRRILHESRALLRAESETPSLGYSRMGDAAVPPRSPSPTETTSGPSYPASSSLQESSLRQGLERMPFHEEINARTSDNVSLAPTTAYSIAATSEMSIILDDPSSLSDEEREAMRTPAPLGDYIEIRPLSVAKIPEPRPPPSPIQEESQSQFSSPTPQPESRPTSSASFKPSFRPNSRLTASMESLATSIYSEAGEATTGVQVSGTIYFSISYEYKSNRLDVKIIRCTNLGIANEKKSTSDPYVKVYLLPDKSRAGKKKTKRKKGTLNPVFNETLQFTVTLSELEHRSLNLTVYHSDRFGRNAFLGEINLEGHQVGELALKQAKKPIDRVLEDRSVAMMPSPLTYKGDLVLSVLFVSPERNVSKRGVPSGRGALAVHVKEARNLAGVKGNGYSDPFCKCYLLPDRSKAGKQKTTFIKKNCDPRWDHTFVFQDLSLKDLRERSVELTIWDFEKIGSNDFLGGLRLCLGTGESYGHPVEWMDSKGEEISMWQAMLDRPDTWIDGTLILRPHMNQRGFPADKSGGSGGGSSGGGGGGMKISDGTGTGKSRKGKESVAETVGGSASESRSGNGSENGGGKKVGSGSENWSVRSESRNVRESEIGSERGGRTASRSGSKYGSDPSVNISVIENY